MARNWIKGAVKRPGAFTKKANAAGMSVAEFARHVRASPERYSTRTKRQAALAQTLRAIGRRGASKGRGG